MLWTKFTQKWYSRSKSEKVNITTEFCTIELEEFNDIFLAGNDALVSLAEPMNKKYTTTFVSGQSYDQC